MRVIGAPQVPFCHARSSVTASPSRFAPVVVAKQRPPESLPRTYKARISLSKLMNIELAAGNTFASPRLARYASYAAFVWKTRSAGFSPSSGR